MEAACILCPRSCGAVRSLSAGRCGVGNSILVSRAAPHMWEEPCISGTCGSGAVFFSGCPLGCVFCQNHLISRSKPGCGQPANLAGKPVTTEALAAIFLKLQNKGVHNLNLVTAGHYAPQVQTAIQLAKTQGLRLPVVWNTSSYEKTQVIKALQPDVDIWLADLKFYAPSLSAQLADAPGYFTVASEAILAMAEGAGKPQYDENGLLKQGLLVRILVLPGQREDAKQLLHWLSANLAPESFILSLMSQYTPQHGLQAPFNRKLASYEYNDVVNTAMELGFAGGYMQQRESAQSGYTPAFDGTGLD